MGRPFQRWAVEQPLQIVRPRKADEDGRGEDGEEDDVKPGAGGNDGVHVAYASHGPAAINERVLILGLLVYDQPQVTDATDIRFDGWTLRPRSGELVRDGKTQRLSQQPLRALLELVRTPSEVVTRERLTEVLWPTGVVEFDNSLNAVVRKLRVALEDDSATPRYIETLPRIGYRFIGTLAPTASAAAPSEPQRVAQQPAPPFRARKTWPRALPAFAAVTGVIAAGLLWWRSYGTGPEPATLATPRVDGIERPTSQRAYELYLDGKFNRSRRDINGNPLAMESLEAALREDPYFAEAWSALAEVHIGSGMEQLVPLANAMEQARTAALRALELEPSLASGHAALGTLLMFYDRDYARAEAEFDKARAADDRYARLWHGYGLLRGFQGRIDEAFAFIGRARELEPTTLLYTSSHAQLLYHTRRYQEAIDYVRPLLASQPRFDQARSILIRSLLELGDVDGALQQLPLRYAQTPILSDDGLVYARARPGARMHSATSSGSSAIDKRAMALRMSWRSSTPRSASGMRPAPRYSRRWTTVLRTLAGSSSIRASTRFGHSLAMRKLCNGWAAEGASGRANRHHCPSRRRVCCSSSAMRPSMPPLVNTR